MDTIESWYSETGGLSYNEPKANTWHLLLWICHKRGSRHPLTAAVHKWSYKLEETLSLWPCQAYGSGCSCLPSPTSLSHVTTGLRTVWHLEETTRSSAKMLGGAGHHEHRVLSFWCLECCDGSVSMEAATTRRRSSVDGERERERERERGGAIDMKLGVFEDEDQRSYWGIGGSRCREMSAKRLQMLSDVYGFSGCMRVAVVLSVIQVTTRKIWESRSR